MASIKAPKVTVLMTNGEEHTVKLTVRNQLQWSRTRRARNWPSDDEILASMFMAWHALHVAGVYSGKWEEFEEDAEWVEEHKDEPEETPENPTQQTPSNEPSSPWQ